MFIRLLFLIVFGNLALIGCSNGANTASVSKSSEFSGQMANPMLWRATLDTLNSLPVEKADPVSGIISYDWGSFEGIPNERIKAIVYILDTRLRADAVKVSLFRETKTDAGTWQAADVSPETSEQIEGRILELARIYKLNSL